MHVASLITPCFIDVQFMNVCTYMCHMCHMYICTCVICTYVHVSYVHVSYVHVSYVHMYMCHMYICTCVICTYVHVSYVHVSYVHVSYVHMYMCHMYICTCVMQVCTFTVKAYRWKQKQWRVLLRKEQPWFEQPRSEQIWLEQLLFRTNLSLPACQSLMAAASNNFVESLKPKGLRSLRCCVV
jgi:hypothetical protein